MADEWNSPRLFTVGLREPDRIAFNSDNNLLAVGASETNRVVVLDLADGREVARIEGARLNGLRAFEFSRNKLLLLRDEACVFYDVHRRTFEPIFTPTSHPQSATIDPAGRLLAVGVTSGLILFDLEKTKVRWRRETSLEAAPQNPAFSPGGKFVAGDFTPSKSGGFILVWDTAHGRRWRTVETGKVDPIVAFRGDTLSFVVGEDGLDLYEPNRGDEPVTRYPNPEFPRAAAFRDTGKLLAAVGYKDGLIVFDTTTGRPIKAINRPDGREIEYSFASPDWSLIASTTKGGVLVWASGGDE